MSVKQFIQISSNKLFPKVYNDLIFLIKNRYFCNHKNPTSFNEKIQWRKEHQHDERFPLMVDKWEVRSYIEKVIPEILVPSLGVYEEFEEIEFDSLPQQFIIKPTHGFGRVIICENKDELNLLEVNKEIKKWLSYNQFFITGEWQYKDIKPRIIIDKLLGNNITDYKFFCFDGEPFAIQIDFDRYINHKRQMRKTDWSIMECELAYPSDTRDLEKPKELDRMIDICRLLSQNYDFVRVDLFLIDGNIYFSELTFTPGNGMDRFSPREMDYYFGKQWKINKE